MGGLDQNEKKKMNFFFLKMEPGSDNEPDLSVRTSVTDKTQFKIQHINHEMRKIVITHMSETTRDYHEADPCT